jgi:hypothetical protein
MNHGLTFFFLFFPFRIIYGYFEIAAKEGDLAGMKGMIMG